jgi:HPt (histidine-containing phosphotransfer) domain-containing protein
MMADGSPALDPATIDTLRQLNDEGQPDVLTEVLGLFLADAPARLEAIAMSARAGDRLALQRAAHTLKGACGAIGAFALEEACRALEHMSKGDRFDDVPAGLVAVDREYARVQEAIAEVLRGNPSRQRS